MRREIDLKNYTDGRLYHSNDLVKVGCNSCEGCSSCCRDMEALILDPYDIFQLKKGLDMDFSSLLEHGIEIRLMENLLLPVMNTDGDSHRCSFLSEKGRCSIHSFRPGICRLFPLGRYYHDHTFSYILQLNQCVKNPKGKVKIKEWLGIDHLKAYENYILLWHDFLTLIREQVCQLDTQQQRILHLYLLKTFFQTDYVDFYPEFNQRLSQAYDALGLR